jgi:cysteine-rich repeat protein
MKYLFVALLFFVSSCAERIFLLVVIKAPSGVIAPEIERLEVTATAQVDGVPVQKVVSFEVGGQSLPLSFFLSNDPAQKGLEVSLSVSGTFGGVEVLRARGSGSLGEEVELTALFCGDTLTQPETGEECDDGNSINGDGCDANCTVSACGNGILSVNEVCLEAAALVKVSIVEPTDIAFGDFDGDGADDLAISSNASGQSRVTFLFNRGLSGFVKEGSDILVAGTDFSSVAVGDFEKDGDLDVVVTDTTNDRVRLIENNGTGAFTLRAVLFSTGNAPTEIKVVDINRDGFDDVITANGVIDFVETSSIGDLSVLINSGTFVTFFEEAIALNTNSRTQTSIITANFNTKDFNFQADDTIDIVAASSSLNQITAKFEVINTIEGTIPSFFSFLTEQLEASSFAIDQIKLAEGDFNNDGNLDIIATHSGLNIAEIFLGSLDGTLTQQANVSLGTRAFEVSTGDFNGDGILDFAILGASGDAFVKVMVGDGTGAFTPSLTLTLIGSIRNKAVVAKDVNEDGIDDLFVVGASSNTIHSFLSNP